MALAFAYHGTLWLVLDEENVERLQKNDPFDFNQRSIPVPMPLAVPLQITVAYAKEAEQASMAKMDPDQLVVYLRRGYTETESDRRRNTDMKVVQFGPGPRRVQ